MYDDNINSFYLAGAGTSVISDLNTGCTSGGYANRTTAVPAINLQQGGNYMGYITTDYSSNEYVRIWIDFNNDQTFSSTEEVASFGPFGSQDGNFPFMVTVPFSAPVANNLRMRVRLAYNPPGAIDPCANEDYGETHDYLANILLTPPCSGTPTPGTVSPAGPLTACAGTVFHLTTSGTTFAQGLTYQWEESPNGTAWSNAVGGLGATTLFYTTPALNATKYYRLKTTCGSQSATTPALVINVTGPAYATLPYTQGFEAWQNYCDVSDVPDNHWLNTPRNGDQSWRRDDQGSTANWTYPPGGSYSPAFYVGSHSARFHTYYANYGSTGSLDVFVDCSGAGNKELQFYHINASGSDALDVQLSTDGGATFTTLNTYYSTNGWELHTMPIVSTSATTVIRFLATSDYSDDIGIDEVKVLPPCTGAPTAGVINPVTPCSGAPFTMTLSGNTAAGSMTYQWQMSTNNTTWTNVPAGTNLTCTYTITAPTYFRTIVTCSISSISDTTPSLLVTLAPFYYCYCNTSMPMYDGDDDIGNVTIQNYPTPTVLLNNGIASPLQYNATSVNTYTNFTGLPITDLYRTVLNKYLVTQINEYSFYNCYAAIYIDFNRNGVFDATEQVLLKPTSTPSQQVSDTFRVPANADIGITGMRVILDEGNIPDPCNGYYYGETEDYLVRINYAPCSGTPAAGVAYVSDTLVCPGDPLLLTDTTHTKQASGIVTTWESSIDGSTWTTVANSTNKDTMTVYAPGTIYYRMKVNCTFSNSSSTSNNLFVNVKAPYKCYCYSYANGGNDDVSDLGAFSIGNFVQNTGGPHLNNVTAIRSYTDYTDNGPAILFVDSAYTTSAYHILKGATQIDAKVTMFIDYNNNWKYDLPDERVWTGYTNINDVYINSTVNIPSTAVTNTITGMRIIINNDLGPNIPSDEACGPYVSGETEDYIVMFLNKSQLNVNNITSIANLAVFPNPTQGKCSVAFTTRENLNNVQLTITNITGQQIARYEYADVSGSFRKDIDLSTQARGVYFVELRANGQKAVRKVVVQ